MGPYTGIEAKADMFRVWLFVVWEDFGLVFVINLMEEEDDPRKLPEAHGGTADPSIMEDETRHEAQLAAMIHEEKLSYISSMVLGLNDALVELTGALAGFTLAPTAWSAWPGSLLGWRRRCRWRLPVSLKRLTRRKSTLKAAVYTGVAYMITVAFLLLPISCSRAHWWLWDSVCSTRH
ncbi:MAG: hypothetical protein ACLSHC_12450 [Bilophila wadsworthia]